jgi:hypothetical protein
MRFAQLTLIIGLVLTACAAPGAPATPPTPTATQPILTMPRPASTSEPLADDVLAIYQKSGCFQGVDEKLIIREDGALIFTTGRGAPQRAQLQADQLNALEELLASSEFAELQPLYQAAGADLCVYTITARRNGEPFSITTMDGAATPEFLAQILQEVERLRQQLR